MPTFAYFIEPAREEFAPENATEAELAAIGEHWNYLVALNEAGKVRFVGRTNNPPYIGLVVFEVEDEAAANEIAENDPAVAAGVFKARVQPYSIFFPKPQEG